MGGPEKHVISKSTYLRGLQCHKSLYLHKNHKELREDIPAEMQAVFDRGIQVGKLARELFPGGVDMSPSTPYNYQKSVKDTAAAIAKGEPVIYEAAFQHEGVLAAVDILVNKNGHWHAYEVKSSGRINNTYIKDAALQFWVMAHCGMELVSINIVHINSSYTRNGVLDIEKLFTTQNIMRHVLSWQKKTTKRIKDHKKVLEMDSVPEVNIGKHCREPYGCDFAAHCWKDVPERSVFSISGVRGDEKFKLFNNGIRTPQDIPADHPLASSLAIKALKDGEVRVRKPQLSSFIKSLKYPLLFADFETWMPAVPPYDDCQPFKQIPFQYSIHKRQERNGKLGHLVYLASAQGDRRREFLEKFLQDTKGKGSILVYNITFERSILARLAELFPDLEAETNDRIERMRDLMIPFQQKDYYHPEMMGYYSIKYVLPALVPDLSYNDLAVQNGFTAMSTFERLQTETDVEKIELMREGLLRYCEMDTLAMVRILEVLEGSISD